MVFGLDDFTLSREVPLTEAEKDVISKQNMPPISFADLSISSSYGIAEDGSEVSIGSGFDPALQLSSWRAFELSISQPVQANDYPPTNQEPAFPRHTC